MGNEEGFEVRILDTDFDALARGVSADVRSQSLYRGRWEKIKRRGPTRVRTGDPLHPKQVSYH